MRPPIAAVATMCTTMRVASTWSIRDLIADWREQAPSGVISRSRVVDNLLDLRGSLPAHDRHLVDMVLAEVPGVTIVESQWWLGRLDWLVRTLELVEPTSGIT